MLSNKFQKFWYQIDEIRPIFAQSLDIFKNMIHKYVYTSFYSQYGGHRYTRRLILQPFRRHVPG